MRFKPLSKSRFEQFEVKHWKNLFFIFRLFVLVYMLGWLIPHAIHPDVQGTFHFYLTNWGEVILIIYFLLAFCSVLQRCKSNCTVSSTSHTTKAGRLSWFYTLQWLWLNIAADIVVLVVVLFWALAARTIPSSAFSNPIIYHLHLVNFILLVADILIIQVPVRLLHFVYGLITAVIYIFFTLILHWTSVRSDIYPGVLDWEDEPITSTLYSLLGTAIVILAHVFVFSLYKLRLWLFARYRGDEATFQHERGITRLQVIPTASQS